MAFGQRLPNGFIVLLLSPREATCLHDEVLEPADFPWQNSESELIGMEVKRVLYGLVAEDSARRLKEISREMMHVVEQQQKGEVDEDQ